jgi:hypothetical protein
MPATFKQIIVTEELLNNEPSSYFVYGDNTIRQGTGGAAKLRHHPRAIGFVTKKEPNSKPSSSFKPDEYLKMFFEQLRQLSGIINSNPQQKFYISKIGGGLANRYRIWELVIRQNLIAEFGDNDNVVFCWDENEQ